MKREVQITSQMSIVESLNLTDSRESEKKITDNRDMRLVVG